ncbi:PLP-dependent aminotransferase family protein [Neisseria sp. Ec49-e6-T10]|uniref:aminotransferase-like domain-containing protein n=1 Tax=Neisseria sp. Ec49-e6-T10 TaxID=3140744 RepID=UPI003EC08612
MFSQRIKNLQGSLIREILAATQRPEVISFAGGLPATDCLPNLDFTGVPAHLAQYGCTEGELELREAIAKHACENLNINCTADQVLILAGSQQALDLAAKLYIDEGTPVLTEAPTYLASLQTLHFFGANITEIAQENGGLNVQKLNDILQSEKPPLAYLIPSFQNPSGACYTEENRVQIAQIFEQNNTTLYEDDPYRDLSYDGDAPKPIVSHLKKASFIYAGSFSKILAPGLRLGYLIASPDLYPYLVKLKQANDLHVNRPAQWYVLKEITKPDFPDHIKKLQASYKIGRDAMQAALEEHFSDLATWIKPKGGLFFWLKLNKKIDTQELLKESMKQNIAFMPGEPFFTQPAENLGYLRLNFSHASTDNIQKGIKILAGLIREN